MGIWRPQDVSGGRHAEQSIKQAKHHEGGVEEGTQPRRQQAGDRRGRYRSSQADESPERQKAGGKSWRKVRHSEEGCDEATEDTQERHRLRQRGANRRR
uniref:Uncharacterized protein n=1 Tax=Chromera velia CCMP2878 TaxID=1169474 RepID=A0A0G4FBT3_9ALVE|eukprot:Cvel_16228.t1-p1 / transcript=Cvel_16228.t1 / gene=Cvel_16228 / organism=Chromera_velia_CCMP2878 / gene_product=hypothetical protein / transcript_product=hypothetical protein / location=Cvel_scaffold1240:44989-45282(-) / protein_length=98 / sequence_SO=supercontig / SO=protein_coding / is_pseudo=false